MTRFARAKGSKASNLKTPEDSTPWEVMREQLLKSKKDSEEAKNREEAEQKRIENYNNFLKEQKTQKRKATWCEFPEDGLRKKNVANTVQIDTNIVSTKNQTFSINNGKVGQNNIKKKKTKTKFNNDTSFKKNEENNIEAVADIKLQDIEVNSTIQAQDAEKQSTIQIKDISLKNKKKKKNQKLSQTITPVETDNITNTHETATNESNSNANNIQKKLKKKRKNSKHHLNASNVTTESDPANANELESVEPSATKVAPLIKKKNKKDNKSSRRKPDDDKSFHLIINSKEVQLIRYDGFPIMKKDADRLEELKKNMIKKGIPKSEVKRTLKLERRRAEKALARLKRDVCYNCRKGGHNLSDCPELKSNIPGGAVDGVCFKCGSTEHRQFECKVQKDKEFRFATCFICKESGHIARQCPDNPKGLYPNGGSCKLCGDVTHLRKDCPTVMDKKEGSSIKLQTLNDGNIEDIGCNVQQPTEVKTKKPKKIKF